MISENSLFRVFPQIFNKELLVPTSKSHANRALIVAALRGEQFKIDHLPDSSDVTTMISCLKKIGLKIERQGNSHIFKNSFPACESETTDEIITLDTKDGGTTNRFLIALLSRGKKCYRLNPSEKMSERPMQELLDPLSKLKVRVTTATEQAWIEIQGPADLSDLECLEVDSQKSSQFASALMLAFHQDKIKINPQHLSSSEGYWHMTQEVLKECAHKNFYSVPIDFSSLSYPLALALVEGKVIIGNCHGIDRLQVDSQLIDLMKEAGADMRFSDQGLVITKSTSLKPFKADGAIFPDLIPTLMFLASTIKGESTISNLGVLRFKESDRLSEMLKILDSFGVDYRLDIQQVEITITGPTAKAPECTVIPARDHRMVMTAYLFLRSHSGGWLGEADCVNKSYPDFFKSMQD